MKVIHVPYTFYPDPVGGTEIYVEALARHLQVSGVESVICAQGATPESYTHSSLRVRRFCGQKGGGDVACGYGEGDLVAAKAFGAVLSAERPQLVHVHALTPAVSLSLAREVKARGIPLVFTYHTPAATCQRGTLLRWGQTRCRGRLETAACASCSLHGLGVPRALASLVGFVPPHAGKLLQAFQLGGGVWTALRMSSLVERKHAAVRAFLGIADRIVAPSEWVRDVLLANGVADSKILLCGQGTDSSTHFAAESPAPRKAGEPLKVVVLGRLNRTKGMDVLIDALAGICDFNITLDIYGESQPGDDDQYGAALSRKVALDSRIRLLPPIPHDGVVSTLARYDALAVPSQGLETGPLVVLEALAAGIPVVGSDLGGIAERIVHERNGILVSPFDRVAWSAALKRLATEPDLLPRLRGGITPPPRMQDVSTVMRSLYAQLV